MLKTMSSPHMYLNFVGSSFLLMHFSQQTGAGFSKYFASGGVKIFDFFTGHTMLKKIWMDILYCNCDKCVQLKDYMVEKFLCNMI